MQLVGNESVPKIIINDTIFFSETAISILVISNQNSARVLFYEIAFVYFIWKININILALEMACPENQHCANCIGTLSFPMLKYIFPNKIYTEAIFFTARCYACAVLCYCPVSVCLSVCHNARVWLAGTVAPLHCTACGLASRHGCLMLSRNNLGVRHADIHARGTRTPV